MRVDERKRRVARERDALARGPERGRARRGRSEIEFAGQRQDSVAIDMRLDEIGDRIEARVERLRLARLHQAEMALGQRDLVVARQRADDRNPHRLDRLDDEPAMALAADAIDDDAGDFQPLVIGRAALDDRRRRLRLARHVDDQQDRHAERRRDVGRGAAAPALAGTPSNSPIEASHSASVAFVHRLRGERGQKVGRHGPGIEVDALAAATRRRERPDRYNRGRT